VDYEKQNIQREKRGVWPFALAAKIHKPRCQCPKLLYECMNAVLCVLLFMCDVRYASDIDQVSAPCPLSYERLNTGTCAFEENELIQAPGKSSGNGRAYNRYKFVTILILITDGACMERLRNDRFMFHF
jgi:hypothetical protein